MSFTLKKRQTFNTEKLPQLPDWRRTLRGWWQAAQEVREVVCLCRERRSWRAHNGGPRLYVVWEGAGEGGIVNQHGTNKKLHSAVPPRTTPSFSIEMRPEKDKCRSLPRHYSKHKQLSLERPQKLQTLERLEVRERLQLKLNRPGGKTFTHAPWSLCFFK